MKATEKQVGGNHYKKYDYQPIEFIYDMNLDFIQGNIIKYIARDKGDRVEDLEKIIHYCELALDLMIESDLNYNEGYLEDFKKQFDDFTVNIIELVILGDWVGIKKIITEFLQS